MQACRAAVCAFAVLVLAGCATTTVQQAGTFGRAGLEYSEAVADFVDVQLASRIDANSKDALRARRQLLDARLEADLPATLARFDAEAFEAVRQTARLRDGLRMLHGYFDALHALATSSVATSSGTSLRALAASIADLNALAAGDEKLFTSEQLGHIDRVGRLAVRAAVARDVLDALERDKRTIGWQIAWQERMLAVLVEPMRAQYERDLGQLRDAKVLDPYASAAAKPETTWINDRRRWIQGRFHVEAFARAREAAVRMRREWELLLAGGSDLQALRVSLTELRELTSAIRAFDDAQRSN